MCITRTPPRWWRSAPATRRRSGPSDRTVASPAIVEPSGLAASRVSPGVIYVHNEDTTAVVAISASNASTLGTFRSDGRVAGDRRAVGAGGEPGLAGGDLCA